MTRRYILTGTPGAGKTSILRRLAQLGHAVVAEAATDVILGRQARGEDAPWTGATKASFIDEVVETQRRRQVAADPTGPGVCFFDRSPVCTHALAVYLGLPVCAALTAELDRIAAEHTYQRQVFFVRNLGFCQPTTTRRIDMAEALRFERIHEDSYREFGYQLIDIPADRLDRRVATISRMISPLAP
ncbi:MULTISPECIES: AAA family ATPase [Mycobacterium]|uniref:NadR/Ttd14 AAA domain-containing protein n=1 Tax=Mycobacterium marinum (strain ATCC BAA-535 / M) TaxID=216594 RepID=B2HGA9_MYCMM|nr:MULTISPECIES: ATP-binding protein [Mycobacterium]ACC43221.1 conserved hypothetical protein [Mycobacterium marinum M]EPQ45539.1 hypothetical protein MMSP_1300 [Mycobacterium sp. 012931]EPQ78513.1 hypothetical protein MMMB2_3175 [Mycobacterium marinum MB2]MBC9863322.1 hypothetical protein [Mycobacterium pseudoshottsii]MDC8973550.1 ATP-binding protein [Mycobacterium marinum]